MGIWRELPDSRDRHPEKRMRGGEGAREGRGLRRAAPASGRSAATFVGLRLPSSLCGRDLPGPPSGARVGVGPQGQEGKC